MSDGIQNIIHCNNSCRRKMLKRPIKAPKTYKQVQEELSAARKLIHPSKGAEDVASERSPILVDRSLVVPESAEVIPMLCLGKMIYTLADLRRVAKSFALDEGGQIREESLAHKLLFGNYNVDEYRKKQWKDEEEPGVALGAKAFEDIIKGHAVLNSACGDPTIVRALDLLKGSDSQSNSAGPIPSSFLNNFDAEFNSHELVYGITASQPNGEKRDGRISVVFRGSVELNDWLHNITIPFEEIRIRIDKKKAWLIEGANFTKIRIHPKIALKLEEKLNGNPIQVHRGFLSYLFKAQTADGISKYEAITRNIQSLHRHKKFNPSEFFITGHSLGGALCTLLSFFLAYDYDVYEPLVQLCKRKYITCISFASPYVGDEGWSAAFGLLETEGRLRHIRVSNEHDFVPLMPPPFKFFLGPCYKHTGVNLHLWPKGFRGQHNKPYISYDGTGKSIFDWLEGDFVTFPRRFYYLMRSPLRGSMLCQLLLTIPLLAVPVLTLPFVIFRGICLWLFPWYVSDVYLFGFQGPWTDMVDSLKWELTVGLIALQILAFFFFNTKGVVRFDTHDLGDYLKNMNVDEIASLKIDSLYSEYAGLKKKQ